MNTAQFLKEHDIALPDDIHIEALSFSKPDGVVKPLGLVFSSSVILWSGGF
jgi:hypothetical protein